VLHAAGKIRFGCLDQRMNVVWHPAIGQDNPAAALDLFSQTLGESLVVFKVMEQSAPSIPTSDDMLVCAGELDSRRSRYRGGSR